MFESLFLFSLLHEDLQNFANSLTLNGIVKLSFFNIYIYIAFHIQSCF